MGGRKRAACVESKPEVRMPRPPRVVRSLPGTWYLFGDAEALVSLGDENPETFAENWRFRVGPGLTANRAWRFELLYIHDITRNTLRDDFDASVNAIGLRAHRFF